MSYAQLKADAAFALTMPTADQLAEVGSEARSGIDGDITAFAGHIFGTSATSADVYTYYGQQLAQLGWRIDTPPYVSSTAELESREYCKTKMVFRLAIKKPGAFDPAFYRGRDYMTVFDARVEAADPGSVCPRPALTPAPTIRR